MVDVGEKMVTKRSATAQAKITVSEQIIAALQGGDIQTKKGPVFHTAIIAGTQAVKKTADLIPFCHSLPIEKVSIDITQKDNQLIIRCEVGTESKTGVEMEALTGATIAALTLYDMCKSITHDMQIESVALLNKTGGKTDV